MPVGPAATEQASKFKKTVDDSAAVPLSVSSCLSGPPKLTVPVLGSGVLPMDFGPELFEAPLLFF